MHNIAEHGRSGGGGLTIIPEDRKPVPRRQFTKLLTLTGLAALATGAWVFLRARRSKHDPEIVVASAGEIPVGGFKIFTYPTDVQPCILLRTAPDTYVAYSRLCTHNSCPVFYKPEENVLFCPCHGGVFSASDGSVLQAPPPRPLPRITIEWRGSNLVATGVMKS